ncbi:MAG: ATP-binding cassette domain-containing protein [Thermoproteus sp.]
MLELRGLRARVGDFELGPVDLAVNGKYLVVMGPNGAGKTTLLKAVAGLLKAEGSVRINGVELSRLPPERRNVAYVPQSYALFDHMTVYSNIEFGLKMRGVPKAERSKAVLEVARALGIETLLYRRPGQLSGGQRQRVALARALAVRPRLLLLDEPLSGLDPDVKEAATSLLRRIPKEHDVPIIHVAHDREEAYSLGEVVAVMYRGKVVESGSPEEVFFKPRRAVTARLVGLQVVNIDGRCLGVRPEDVVVGSGPFRGVVVDVVKTLRGVKILLEGPLGRIWALSDSAKTGDYVQFDLSGAVPLEDCG